MTQPRVRLSSADRLEEVELLVLRARPCCVALLVSDVAALVGADEFSGECPAQLEALLKVSALEGGRDPRVLLMRGAPSGIGLGVSAGLHLQKVARQSLLPWPNLWLSRGLYQSVVAEDDVATTLVLDSERLVRRLRSLVEAQESSSGGI